MSSECWWQDRVLLVGCKSCIIPKAPMTHGFKDKSGTFNEHLTRITPSVSSVFPMHAQAQKNLKVECPFSWSTMCFTRAFHSSELGSHLMKASSIHQAQFWPCKSFKLWRTSLGDSWFLVSEGSIMMIMVSTNAQLALHRWAPLPVQFSSQPAATGRRHAHPESAIPCQANLWHSWHSSEDTKSEKASNRFQNFHLFFQ